LIWDGIYVRSGAKLTAWQNCIEDGYLAIRLYDESVFEIFQNTFHRNFVAIFGGRHTPSEPLANLYPYGVGISDNDISGADLLLQNVANSNRPVGGIAIQRAAELFIGGQGVNEIHDFSTALNPSPFVFPPHARGISSANSNLTVTQTRFYNIGYQTPTAGGTAIDSYNTFTQNNLTVFGLGKESGIPTFQACETGILSQDNYLTLNSCYFDFGNQHVKLYFPYFPHRFDISQNRFKSFEALGIAANKGSFIRCNIYENLFEDDINSLYYEGSPNSSPGLFNTKHSIIAASYASQLNPGPNYYLKIFNNQFNELQKPGGTDDLSGGYGVSLYNMRAIGKVYDNAFSQQHNATARHFYKGVYLHNSKENQVRDNTFSGVANYVNPVNNGEGLSGISVYEAAFNTIRCNNLYNLQEGMRFEGFNCDGTTLFANQFSGHNTGLLLRTPATRVGQQTKRYNTWPGASALPDREAFFAGNPSDQLLELSRFRIEYLESPSSRFWANPRTPQAWFQPTMDATEEEPPINVDYCFEILEEKQLTRSEELLLSGAFPVHDGYAELAWEAAFGLYDRLWYDAELRPAESPAATFFAAQANTNLSKLHNALIQYGSVDMMPAGISEQWEDTQTQLDGLFAQLRSKHQGMAIAETIAEKDQLLAELISLNAQLNSLQSTKENLSATFLSERQNKLAQLFTHLSGISPNTVYESNLKTVVTILTEALANNSGETFDENQTASLKAIADQCRYSGGYGVVLARTALNKAPHLFDDAALCTGGLGPRGDVKKVWATAYPDIQVTLYPNPAGNAIQVQIPEGVSAGELRLNNAMGARVRTMPVPEGATIISLDLSGLPAGIYLLEATLDGRRLPALRFMKLTD